MSQTSDNNRRIAKNTLLLNFRMLFMMVVVLSHIYKSSQFHSFQTQYRHLQKVNAIY